jgi:hypothetical protein
MAMKRTLKAFLWERSPFYFLMWVLLGAFLSAQGTQNENADLCFFAFLVFFIINGVFNLLAGDFV